jgi:anti-anti-sigma regulatory factor
LQENDDAFDISLRGMFFMALKGKNKGEIGFKFIQSGDTGIYTFDGELTAEYVDDLKRLLMVAMYRSENIIIDLRGVNRIDLPCSRLLKMAYDTSKRLQKIFLLNGIDKKRLE